jgi:hypothetical protein
MDRINSAHGETRIQCRTSISKFTIRIDGRKIFIWILEVEVECGLNLIDSSQSCFGPENIYLSIYLSIYSYLSTYGSTVLVYLGRFFSFLIYTQLVGLLGRGITPRKAATYTQNIRTQTSIPRVGFEPTIPVFERATTVHDLDRAATVIVWSWRYTN